MWLLNKLGKHNYFTILIKKILIREFWVTMQGVKNSMEIAKTSNPLLLSWLKWNMDTSRTEAKKSYTTSSVCRDTTGRIHHLMGNTIEKVPIIMAETMTIREAVRMAIQLRSSWKETHILQLLQLQAKLRLQDKFSIE